MIIRHEINLINREIVQDVGDALSYLDTSVFSGSCTYYFEAVCASATGVSGAVSLRVPPTTTKVGLTTGTSTSYTRRRIVFTPSATDEYEVICDTQTKVLAARIIIIQDTSTDPLIASESQIEIGNYEEEFFTTGLTDFNPLANPKYWYYDSDNWDGGIEVFAEVVWISVNDKYSLNVRLEEDDGSFGNWATVGTILSVGVNEDTVTRTRSSNLFGSMTSGRNYRLAIATEGTKESYGVNLYSAKIIVRQNSAVYEKDSGAETSRTIGATSAEAYVAGSFSLASAITCKTVSVKLNKLGSPTGTISCFLYTDGGLAPDSLIATSATTLESSVVTTEKIWYDFVFSQALSATTYWVVLTTDSHDGYSDVVYWYYDNADTSYRKASSDDASSWSSGNDTHFLKILIDPITKLEEQYLLLNTGSDATGLQDMDSYYDADEWDGVTVDLYPEHDASDSSSNTKLQEDVDGTPSDVSDSSITGVNRTRGATVLSITDNEDIDTYVVVA